MALDVQLVAFMPHTVTIQSYSAKNSYGEDTHSANTRTAAAYVDPNKVRDNTVTTQEQHQPKQIYVNDTNITLRDKITLPDGTTPKITSVEVHDVVAGIEHSVVTFA